MAIRQLNNLLPGALVRDAARLELDAFLRQFGTAPLLLVRITEEDSELRAGLQASWLPSGTQDTAQVAPMRFRTSLLRAHPEGAPAPSRPSRGHDHVLLALREGLHFAAIIRSRRETDSGPLRDQRVALGRTTNNDVVLRHTSVSKFHASLETTDRGTVKIVDNGSTNGTSLNDVRLKSRAPAEARSGDRLRFGDVEAILWSPQALWTSLRSE